MRVPTLLQIQSVYTGITASRLEVRAQKWRDAAQRSPDAWPRRTAAQMLSAAARGAAKSQNLFPLAQIDARLTLVDASHNVQIRRSTSSVAALATLLAAAAVIVPKIITAGIGAAFGVVFAAGGALVAAFGFRSQKSERSPHADEPSQRVSLPDADVTEQPLPPPATGQAPKGLSAAHLQWRAQQSEGLAVRHRATSWPMMPSSLLMGSQRSGVQTSSNTPVSDDFATSPLFSPSRCDSAGSVTSKTTLDFDYDILADSTLSCASGPAVNVKLELPLDAWAQAMLKNHWTPEPMTGFVRDAPLDEVFLSDFVRLIDRMTFFMDKKVVRIDEIRKEALHQVEALPARMAIAEAFVTPLLVELCDNKPHWAHAVSKFAQVNFWADAIFAKCDMAWSIDGEHVIMPMYSNHFESRSFELSAPDDSGAVTLCGKVLWKPWLGEDHGIDLLERASSRVGGKQDPIALGCKSFEAPGLFIDATLKIFEPQFDAEKNAFADVMPQSIIELKPAK